MADSDTIRRLWLLKSDLEENPDDDKLLQILKKLCHLPVSISALQETGIGKIVNSFKKREGIAGNWAHRVVATWKTAVEKEVKQQEEEVDSSGDGDSRNGSSEDDVSVRSSVESRQSEGSEGGAASPRRIKEEKLSSSDEASEHEDEHSRHKVDDSSRRGNREGRHRSKNTNKLKMNAHSEDDLTDSDLEEDSHNKSSELSIENYYQRMLGQEDARRGESERMSTGSKHKSSHKREDNPSSKTSSSAHHRGGGSSSSSSSKHRGDGNHRINENSSNDNVKHERKRKKYHSLSEEDEEKEVKQSEKTGSRENHSSDIKRHAKDKYSSQEVSKSGHRSKLSGPSQTQSSPSSRNKSLSPHSEKSDKNSSLSSSGEKAHKHTPSLSSSIEKHQKHTLSSSDEKHRKRTPSSSGEKHPSSSSAEKYHKHTSSSSGEKHHKHSSSSGEKHQKHTSSSSGEKHQKHTSSSSGDKHTPSSSGDKHTPSSSGDKHHKHTSSSSGEKHQKHTSSSGDKLSKHASSSSGDKHQKHTSSSSSDKYKKHTLSSSGEKDKKRMSSSQSDEKHHKRSSSSSKHSLHNGHTPDKAVKNEFSSHECSKLLTAAVDMRNEGSGEEEKMEYIPSMKGLAPVEYVPSKKIKLEPKGEQDVYGKRHDGRHERNKYVEALQRNHSEDGDSDRYSPTAGWKIKKERVCDDHKYGGGVSVIQFTNESESESSSSSSPLPYVPSRNVKQEKEEEEEGEAEEEEEEEEEESYSYDSEPCDVPYIPTKKIKQEKPDSESNLQTTEKKERREKSDKIYESKRSKNVVSGREESSHHRHSTSSGKSGESSSQGSHQHKSSSEKSKSSEKRKLESDKHEKRSSSSLSSSSSNKHERHSSSSGKQVKSSSSSSSSSSNRKHHSSSSHKRDDGGHAEDARLLKEKKRLPSDKVSSHESHTKKKEAALSQLNSTKSSKPLLPSDKRDEKTKSSSNSSTVASSSSSLSSSTKLKSSSSAPKKSRDHKKRKENLFADGGLGLFSDTIELKAETSPCPPSHQGNKRHSSSTPTATSRRPDSEHTKATTKKPARIASPVGARNIEETPVVEQFENDVEETAEDSPAHRVADEGKKSVASEKKRARKSSYHLDEGGMSFDDFLNFDEAAVVKQKKPTSSKASHKSSKSSRDNPSSSRMVSLFDSSSSSDSLSLSIPAPSKTVSVTEKDILSLLPETQAFYRPLRPNPMYERDGESFEPVDPDVIVSKSKARSKVYSGRRHVMKEMKSLYDLCLQVLINNIDALEFVGGVPYSILKPVLDRCSATQLYQLEDYNPQFLEESDELWESHCERDFRGTKPEEMESWRELYLRKFEERDAKFQKLKANMSSVITKGQAGRRAKLAFVDSVAKPPREVLRQQKRYGTGCVVMASKSGRFTKETGSGIKTYKPSIIVPVHNPMDDDRQGYKPSAPMMAKALQMRKNMRR